MMDRTRCRRWAAAAFVLLLLTMTAACGPKKPELPPANVAAKYPDFIYPAALANLGSPEAQERHQAAWQWLQAGDLKAAERNFEAALKLSSDFYPAEAGLGYVNLAKRSHDSALDHFDRAVVANPRYVPALAGRGEALLALGQREPALKSFEAAVTTDPSLDALRTRIAVLQARGQQDDVAAARKALEGGRLDEARAAYERAIVASPESPFLYRELADVMRREGNLDAAAEQAARASALDPTDARAQTLLGEIHEARTDLPAAIAAYEASLKLEPNPALARKLDTLREAAVLAKMPAEFQQIESAPTVSREQLAALVGVRLDDLLQRVQSRTAVVITDTRGSWASPWILAVTRAGVMQVYPNHTFEPSAPVRRGDLADAASRVLSIIAAEKPAVAAVWRGSKPQFADLAPSHVSYPAASLSVGAGVLQPLPDGSFQLARPVTGAEAVAAVKKLEELAESSVR
jgi:tetratricopeptide (TPR) repeat protein